MARARDVYNHAFKKLLITIKITINYSTAVLGLGLVSALCVVASKAARLQAWIIRRV